MFLFISIYIYIYLFSISINNMILFAWNNSIMYLLYNKRYLNYNYKLKGIFYNLYNKKNHPKLSNI